MEREKKKMVAFGVLLGIIILVSVIYFFWGNYINRGTINIIGDAPFEVEIVGIGRFNCDTSPCEIDQKIGEKDLIIRKEGYEGIVTEVDVELFKKVDLNIEFEVIPYIVRTEQIPQEEEKPQYKIIYSEENQMYKLIEKNDEQEKAIVYFPNKINEPLIFSSETNALIIEQNTNTPSVYRVDILGKSREKIPNFNYSNITNIKWSTNGSYLVFTCDEEETLLLIGPENEIEILSIYPDISIYEWANDKSLIFITQQNYENIFPVGSYKNYINLSSDLSDSYIMGTYHADEGTYSRMGEFPEIVILPDKLLPTSNEKVIYYQSGEDKYKVNLK